MHKRCTVRFRYPIDLDQFPEDAAELLEAAATERQVALTEAGQHSTHTALEAHVLAVLDMALVDKTIEEIASQVLPSPKSLQSRLLRTSLGFIAPVDT